MKKIVFIILFIFSISESTVLAQETIVYVLAGVKEKERAFRIGKRVVEEVSKKMGTPGQLKYLPSKRAQMMLSNGEIHAELSRVDSYGKLVPDAIKVDEPVVEMPYLVYTVNKMFKVDGWESLKPYKISTVRGAAFVSDFLKEHTTHPVTTNVQAFKLLLANRADISVNNPIIAGPILNSPEFKGKGIKALKPPVDYMRSYTFFSAKYSNYASKFHKALLELKKEGVYQKIFSETK